MDQVRWLYDMNEWWLTWPTPPRADCTDKGRVTWQAGSY